MWQNSLNFLFWREKNGDEFYGAVSWCDKI